MTTRHVLHGLLFNEKEFVLCYRKDSALVISTSYKLDDVSSTERKDAMMHLAYFLAHAMCRGEPYDGYELDPQLLEVAATSRSPLGPTSKRNTGHHRAAASVETIRVPTSQVRRIHLFLF